MAHGTGPSHKHKLAQCLLTRINVYASCSLHCNNIHVNDSSLWKRKGKRKACLSVGGIITGGKTSLLSGMYMYMNVAETAAAVFTQQQQAELDHFFSMNMETLAETMTTETKMLHTHPNAKAGRPCAVVPGQLNQPGS